MEGEQNPAQRPPDELRPIRTFQSDVEEVMKRQQVSRATIAIAESERRAVQEKQAAEAPAPPPQSSKVFHIEQALPVSVKWRAATLLPIAVVFLFLVGTGTGLYLFFSEEKTAVSPEEKTQVPPSAGVLLGENERRTGVIKTLQNRLDTLSVPQNELRTIPITLGNAPITTAELLGKLETAAPGPLVRALGATPTLGVHGFRGGQPFVLWSVSSYDHAFAGMLAWEEDMLSDIGPLFGISPRALVETLSSTTAEVLQHTLVFKDIVARNKDVRAVFGPKGGFIFLYAFIDKETLVLTTNEDTLKFLMGRAGGGRLR